MPAAIRQLRFASTLQTQFFIWDFAKQGGAIGSYTTGIDIPNAAIVLQATSSYFCLTGIGNLPDLSLGTITTPAAFWTQAGAGTGAGVWAAPTAVGTNLLMDNTQDVVFTIATNAMTVGKLICYIQYFYQ